MSVSSARKNLIIFETATQKRKRGLKMCLFISRLKANFRDSVKEAGKSGGAAEIVIEINEGQRDAIEKVKT